MQRSYFKVSIMAFIAICLMVTYTLLFGNSSKEELQYNKDNSIGNTVEIQKPMNWPWRGVNLVIYDQNDMPGHLEIKNLKKQNINFISLALSIPKYAKRDHVDVQTAIIRSFEDADTVIGWCKNEGIAVSIAYDDFPLDPKLKINQTDSKFWNNQKLLDKSINFIGEIVKHFDHWENVVEYAFISEPVVKDSIGYAVVPKNWKIIFDRIRKKVRSISQKFIVYDPGPWADPQNFKTFGNPIKDNKIIYGFHFFEPYSYNYQLLKKGRKRYNYPGLISGKYWDINTIRRQIKYAYDWCSKNQKLLYCGSFGVPAGTPGRAQYLKDLLTVFEEYNISYAYWCYNGFVGWKYNYVYDYHTKKYIPSVEKTQTQKILEQFWELNKRN